MLSSYLTHSIINFVVITTVDIIDDINSNDVKIIAYHLNKLVEVGKRVRNTQIKLRRQLLDET